MIKPDVAPKYHRMINTALAAFKLAHEQGHLSGETLNAMNAHGDFMRAIRTLPAMDGVKPVRLLASQTEPVQVALTWYGTQHTCTLEDTTLMVEYVTETDPEMAHIMLGEASITDPMTAVVVLGSIMSGMSESYASGMALGVHLTNDELYEFDQCAALLGGIRTDVVTADSLTPEEWKRVLNAGAKAASINATEGIAGVAISMSEALTVLIALTGIELDYAHITLDDTEVSILHAAMTLLLSDMQSGNPERSARARAVLKASGGHLSEGVAIMIAMMGMDRMPGIDQTFATWGHAAMTHVVTEIDEGRAPVQVSPDNRVKYGQILAKMERILAHFAGPEASHGQT